MVAYSRAFSHISRYKVLLASGAICSGIALQKRHHADSSNATTAEWHGRPVVDHNSTLLERRRRADPDWKDKFSGSTTLNNDQSAVKDKTEDKWIVSDRISSIGDTLSGFDFVKLRDAIADFVVPSWVKFVPGLVKKVQDEMSMATWSLGWMIWEEAHDPQINPEIIFDASVRISEQLCPEELQFLAKRRIQTAKALARYLDEPDVHPEDVPTIAICGSGGGLRALIAGTSSYLATREAGLFDCVTYSAGVSGSCWLQALFYSSIGQTSHQRIIEHLKNRLQIHICYPPAWLKLLTEAPTNKFLLSGVVEKLKGVPDAEFGLVDVYGLLLAARLLVPKGELRVSDWDLKVSNQKYFIDEGNQPLPIYTAVRHEIPVAEVKELADPSTRNFKDWQWVEWTPYEMFCEDIGAGIPTWSVGRRFKNGQTVLRENGLSLPEVKMPLLLGIWGSAFCASLSHYAHEISPILRASGLAGIDSLLAENDADLVKMHPLDPASIPNYALNLRDRLPATCPESLQTAEHLRLMDAGMSNNLPIYPLLRPGRDVDVIIAFDVSADAPEANWIKVVEGYAKQRGIRGWPMGSGWPPRSNTEDKTKEQIEEAHAKVAASEKSPDAPAEDLSYCTVWVGSSVEKTPEHSKSSARRLQPHEDWHLSSDESGIALVYFPLLKNDKVRGVDPQTSDYMSTWNFSYTTEQIDSVVALAKANFAEGSEQTKRVIRAVYERKRDARLEKKRQDKELRRRLQMRRGEHLGRIGEGDHFS